MSQVNLIWSMSQMNIDFENFEWILISIMLLAENIHHCWQRTICVPCSNCHAPLSQYSICLLRCAYVGLSSLRRLLLGQRWNAFATGAQSVGSLSVNSSCNFFETVAHLDHKSRDEPLHLQHARCSHNCFYYTSKPECAIPDDNAVQTCCLQAFCMVCLTHENKGTKKGLSSVETNIWHVLRYACKSVQPHVIFRVLPHQHQRQVKVGTLITHLHLFPATRVGTFFWIVIVVFLFCILFAAILTIQWGIRGSPPYSGLALCASWPKVIR